VPGISERVTTKTIKHTIVYILFNIRKLVQLCLYCNVVDGQNVYNNRFWTVTLYIIYIILLATNIKLFRNIKQNIIVVYGTYKFTDIIKILKLYT